MLTHTHTQTLTQTHRHTHNQWKLYALYTTLSNLRTNKLRTPTHTHTRIKTDQWLNWRILMQLHTNLRKTFTQVSLYTLHNSLKIKVERGPMFYNDCVCGCVCVSKIYVYYNSYLKSDRICDILLQIVRTLHEQNY